MHQCPAEYRRNIKAEVKKFLGIAATAILFDLMLIIAFVIN